MQKIPQAHADREVAPRSVFWCGEVAPRDSFGASIVETFIDGKCRDGRWAIMTPTSWSIHRIPGASLGPGFGQKYQRQADGRWLKVEG